MGSMASRRDFLKTSALAGAGFWVSGSAAPLYSAPKSANEKLNIGCIGCGGKGRSDVRGVSSENIVALCEVDEKRGAKTLAQHPKANKYHDFRKMLETEKLDAVTVSTPDHTHAPAAMMAMRMGLHVFVQKPLTYSVYEARLMRDTAREYKVATQMGNQGTSGRGLREGVEVIQSGAIGPVREVHVWTNRPVWPQGSGTERPRGMQVPNTLKWDLWLSAAPERLYSEVYCPFNWRGWLDYGTGALGDMACHTANLPFMALKLEHPTRVEAVHVKGFNDETFPNSSTIRFDFPARGQLPALTFFWYDGGDLPPAEVSKPFGELKTSGAILVGDEGSFYTPDDYGQQYIMAPQEKFAEYKPPTATLPRSPGHYKEWLLACKGGAPAMSNFEYAGLLTETILLGNVAMRAGTPIDWDGPRLRVKNNLSADQFITREYRKGWEV